MVFFGFAMGGMMLSFGMILRMVFPQLCLGILICGIFVIGYWNSVGLRLKISILLSFFS